MSSPVTAGPHNSLSMCERRGAVYQQLLRDLKGTVEGLLNCQVANVWQIYGGLNRLHVDVQKIFRDGCKGNGKETDADYWQFIQGLEWLQPDKSSSTFTLDCEYKPHLPQNLKSNKSSIWLYHSLENHSLSQKLSWLLSDKAHVLTCYHPEAFLAQDSYAEATLICLKAVEKNQPALISEIKPNLFLLSNNAKDFVKMHRRCSSFPDAHLRNKESWKGKTSQSFDSPLPKCKELDTTKIKGKLRAWNSLPNMVKNVKTRVRCNTVAQSSPSTPSRFSNEKVSPSLLKVDYESLQKSALESRPKKPSLKRSDSKLVKHVNIIDNDVIEHTPPLSSSHSSTNSKKFSVKSPTKSFNSAEYGFLTSIGEKDFTKKPKKSFIEDGGMSVQPMATGYFPRPMKGQTLTSFLKSSQFADAELDRENAHFNISEAVISAMEQIKCRKGFKLDEEESDEEINRLNQRIRMRRRIKMEEKMKIACGSLLSDGKTDTTGVSPTSASSSVCTLSMSSSSEEVEDIEIDEASTLSENPGFSMSMASLYSEADIFKRPREAPDGASDILSAEGVALSLISKFSEKQLPRASDLEWLVSEEDAPQALLPLPKSWPISPDDGEKLPMTNLRGTAEWAPPRPQVIFTLHPDLSRKELISKQNYRCAGCGMRVAKQYASRFRYCNYLGRYFCTGCHSNQLSLIPAQVIQKWNFCRYAVSSFSYRLLEQMYSDPLFRIFALNKNIGITHKNVQICWRFRKGLSYLKDFILTCRFAETIQDYLRNEKPYIINDPDIFSMEDLVSIRTGEMKSRLRHIVSLCCRHTAECQLCLARGFICEICHSKEVIFPWQMRTVRRCSKCGSCSHTKCWSKTVPQNCNRCWRIASKLCRED